MLNVVMSDAGQVAQGRPHMHRGKSGSVRANDEPSIGSCAVKCGRCVSICLQLIPFCLPRHVFVWCAVRSIARQHDVGCTMSTHRICCVFNCVLISSVFFVKHYLACCVQGKPTSIYHRCASASFFGRAFALQNTNLRPTHNATGFAGEVLILCRAQEMTESDTVCCRNVLCRSICHRPSDPCV